MQKQMNRIKDKCLMYQESNDLKKLQIKQFHNLLNKLIDEKRITLDEIGEYIVKKRVAKANLK